MAARAGRRARLRRRARARDRGRGKAAADRASVARHPIRRPRRGPARDRRQDRRGTARAATRRRDRARCRRRRSRAPSRPRYARHRGAEAAAAPGAASPAPLLFGLPAQHFHPRTRRQPRARRHRLPYAGAVVGAAHANAHPDGRRRGQLDRPGAVHRNKPRVRQHRRRHLLPLRLARDPRRDLGRRQHHLQAALQRRGRHDRRPAGRGQPVGARHRPRARRGGRRARRRGGRGPGPLPERRSVPARHGGDGARRLRLRPGRARPGGGRLGAGLRPGLRRREAPPPPARHARGPRPLRVHQRARVRRLRRLPARLPLPVGGAGGDAARREAPHRSRHLQQGRDLRRRLLPGHRHRRGRPPAPPRPYRARRSARTPRGPARARPAVPRCAVAHPGRRYRWHRRGHGRPPDRHGGAPRRPRAGGARPDRPRPEGRRRGEPRHGRARCRPRSAPRASAAPAPTS